MKNIVFILPLICLFAGCRENAKTQTIDDGVEKDIYDVVNACLASRDTRESTATWNVKDELSVEPYYENRPQVEYLKDYFLKKHATDIVSQLKDSTVFHLEQEKILKDARVVSSDTLRNITQRLEKKGMKQTFCHEFEKRYDGWLISISKPLFSQKKDFALVHIGHYCSGASSGFEYKLRRKNGRWVIQKISLVWIS